MELTDGQMKVAIAKHMFRKLKEFSSNGTYK